MKRGQLPVNRNQLGENRLLNQNQMEKNRNQLRLMRQQRMLRATRQPIAARVRTVGLGNLILR